MTIHNLNKRRSFTTLYIVFTVLVVVNILTISSQLTLIVTLPEYAIVLYLLFKGDIKSSVLLHFTFITLSLSAQGTLGMFEDHNLIMYNYGTVKLIGPVRACYALNIIYCIALLGKAIKLRKSSLFLKLYKTLCYLCISATIIGIGGLIINQYYSFDSFKDYGIYAFVIVTTMFIIVRVADHSFIKDAYHLTLVSIMAGICGSFLCYISGRVVSHYSIYDIAYLADITLMAPALIIGIPQIRQKGLMWISLLLYSVLIITALGGKSVFALAFSFLALVYLLYFDIGTKQSLLRKDIMLRPMVLILGIGVLFYVMQNVTSESMAGYKFSSFLSLFSGDLSSISRSPYIRIASLMNIINDGLSNPFALFFGNGFGGFFQDNLGLFTGIDLSHGAFKDEIVASGRFTTGHDTMVTVPLFNGLVGLFLVIKITWQYVKRINKNYMSSIAFFWLFLMFYFNTIYAMIGLFGLIGAEYSFENEQ